MSWDSAWWIYRACEVMPNTVFVLDRFHASKAFTAAAVSGRTLGQADRKGMNRALEAAAARRRDIAEVQR